MPVLLLVRTCFSHCDMCLVENLHFLICATIAAHGLIYDSVRSSRVARRVAGVLN